MWIIVLAGNRKWLIEVDGSWSDSYQYDVRKSDCKGKEVGQVSLLPCTALQFWWGYPSRIQNLFPEILCTGNVAWAVLKSMKFLVGHTGICFTSNLRILRLLFYTTMFFAKLMVKAVLMANEKSFSMPYQASLVYALLFTPIYGKQKRGIEYGMTRYIYYSYIAVTKG